MLYVLYLLCFISCTSRDCDKSVMTVIFSIFDCDWLYFDCDWPCFDCDLTRFDCDITYFDRDA